MVGNDIKKLSYLLISYRELLWIIKSIGIKYDIWIKVLLSMYVIAKIVLSHGKH